MKAEVRADGIMISGYVNVPGRISSRPVFTRKHGKCMEVIEQRAFAEAIKRTSNIKMLLDHNEKRELAQVNDKTLTLVEDSVGLRATAFVKDREVVENVDKLKGWSFQMKEIVDELEERAEGLPLRHVKSFEMPEISLILHKTPIYSSTSIEVRADEEGEVEYRAEQQSVEVKKDGVKLIDYTSFKNRISAARIAER